MDMSAKITVLMKTEKSAGKLREIVAKICFKIGCPERNEKAVQPATEPAFEPVV